MTVVDHPSQKKNPFDASRFQTAEDVQHGVPVTGGKYPWRWLPVITPDFVSEAFPLYAPYAGDGVDWTSFAQKAQRALILTRDDCWLAFDSHQPGMSVQVHGGKYAGAERAIARDRATHDVLDLILETFKVPMVKAFIPEHARAARMWAKSMGFMEFGVIPLAGTYEGVPRNLSIFGYTGVK